MPSLATGFTEARGYQGRLLDTPAKTACMADLPAGTRVRVFSLDVPTLELMTLFLPLDGPTEFLLPLTALRDVRCDVLANHLLHEGRGFQAVEPGGEFDAGP